MADITTLLPPIDAGIEQEIVAFDYGMVLTNATISTVVAINIFVLSGVDPAPTSRVIGVAQVAPSPTTGVAATAVLQKFGNMLDQVVYGLQCVALTSDGQTLCCDAELPSRKPFG